MPPSRHFQVAFRMEHRWFLNQPGRIRDQLLVAAGSTTSEEVSVAIYRCVAAPAMLHHGSLYQAFLRPNRWKQCHTGYLFSLAAAAQTCMVQTNTMLLHIHLLLPWFLHHRSPHQAHRPSRVIRMHHSHNPLVRWCWLISTKFIQAFRSSNTLSRPIWKNYTHFIKHYSALAAAT